MAIIARVAQHGMTDQFDLTVAVQFFDDNDPANAGVTPPGVTPVVEPGNPLRVDSWSYPPTLTGSDLQAQLAADIHERGAAYVRARNASLSAAQTVPIGSLVNVEA